MPRLVLSFSIHLFDLGGIDIVEVLFDLFQVFLGGIGLSRVG